MREIKTDPNLIAACGLYCGACKAYLKEKCAGCKENMKAGWCSVRKCCMEKSYKSCAECVDFSDLKQCGKLNNFISKIFALIFRSNRYACLEAIRVEGYDKFAETMASNKSHTIKR